MSSALKMIAESKADSGVPRSVMLSLFRGRQRPPRSHMWRRRIAAVAMYFAALSR